MRNLILFILLLTFTTICAQELEQGWMNSEVFFITTELDEEEYIHYHAEPIGTRWTAEDTSPPSNFTITTDYGEGWYPDINEPGIGNVDPEDPFNYYRDCNGFDFVNATPYYNDYVLSYGIYKISISESGRDAYFYLDYRDTKYRSYPLGDCHPVDIFFIYDGSEDRFGYQCDSPPITINPDLFTDIEDGEYLTIWDIKEQSLSSSPATSGFEDYWQNCLALIPSTNNHPKLVWGPYPDDNFAVQYYKIYKKKGSSTFTLAHTTSNQNWIDASEIMIFGPPQSNEGICYYKISAVGVQRGSSVETGVTNTVDTRVQGSNQEKVSSDNWESKSKKFALSQNYPNPFNPTTTIDYSIKTVGKVTIKIYNVLGTEVAELVNELKEAGDYSVNFNASKLPSGIYFCTLLSGNYTESRKLILLK